MKIIIKRRGFQSGGLLLVDMAMVARSSKGTNIKAAVVGKLLNSNLLPCLKPRGPIHADKLTNCRGEILILCRTAVIVLHVPRRRVPSPAVDCRFIRFSLWPSPHVTNRPPRNLAFNLLSVKVLSWTKNFEFPSAAPQPPTVCLTSIFGKMGRKSRNHAQAKSTPVL